MSDIVERLNEAAADERKRLHDLGIGLGVHGDVLYGTAAATIRDLQAKIQDLEKGKSEPEQALSNAVNTIDALGVDQRLSQAIVHCSKARDLVRAYLKSAPVNR